MLVNFSDLFLESKGEPIQYGKKTLLLIDHFPVENEFQPLNGELIFDKNVNSAFKDTGLLEYLRQKEERDRGWASVKNNLRACVHSEKVI